jgi:hypothetical protein
MQQNQPGSTLVEGAASFIPPKTAKYVFTSIINSHLDCGLVFRNTWQEKAGLFLPLMVSSQKIGEASNCYRQICKKTSQTEVFIPYLGHPKSSYPNY